MRLAKGAACLAMTGIVCGYGVYRTAAVETAKNAPLSFVQLAATETMTMDIFSQGCFHQTRRRLEYAPVPTPRVTVYKGDVVMPGKAQEPMRLVGTVTLTPAQLERLDNRLRYYRVNKTGGCTTTDRVTVTAFRAGVTTGIETYTDSTCGLDTLDDADLRDIAALPNQARRSTDPPRPVLSLHRVFEIAEQSGKQNAPLPYQDIPREKTRAYEDAQRHRQKIAQDKKSDVILRALPGFAAVNKQFAVSNVNRAYYMGHGDVFAADLVARNSRIVDKIDVYLPTKNNKVASDWNAVLPVLNRVEARVKATPWIAAWKAGNVNRHVTIRAQGNDVLEEEEPWYYVYPAWKHAGLKGLPVYAIFLRWENDSWATVYVGDKDNRALLTGTNSRKTAGGGWFSEVKVSYHPTQTVPEYYVIAPDGGGKRNTRPDPETPQWFAKRKSRLNP